MTIYNDDTRESYISRMEAEHLHWAEIHHRLGHQRSMWLQLLYRAMSQDIYGEHWDKLQERKK